MKRKVTGAVLIALSAVVLFYVAGCGGGGKSLDSLSSVNSAAAGAFVNPNPDQLPAYTAAQIGNAAAPVTTFADGTTPAAGGATFLDMAKCKTCHRAIYESYLLTNHATAWQRKAVDIQQSTGKSTFGASLATGKGYCVNCHAVNTPFIDANANHKYDAGEVAPFGLAAVTYADYTVVPTEFKGIQCENCHGPASLHAPAAGGPNPSKIVNGKMAGAASTCNYCHASYQNNEWAKSKHGVSASSDDSIITGPAKHPLGGWHDSATAGNTGSCSGCHTGDGFAKAISDSQEPKDYCATGYTGANKATNCVGHDDATRAGNGFYGVTCVACHDPHATAKGSAQLRVDAADLCGKCHNDRYRKYVSAGITKYSVVPGSGRGPHYAGQLEMVTGGASGNGAVQPTTGTPDAYTYAYSNATSSMYVKWAFINSGPAMGATNCVDCHMYSSGKWYGHTFKAQTQACQKCHTGQDSASVINGKQERFEQKFSNLETRFGNYLVAAGAIPVASDTSSCSEKINGGCCNALKTGSTNRDLCSMVEYNVRLLETDGSKGVHNEKYVSAIYDASDKMLTLLGY